MDKNEKNKKENKEEIEVQKGSGEDESQRELEECRNKYKRVLADYQNLEKRTREERLEWIRGSNRELLLRFLPILDTLGLAVVHSKDQSIQVSLNQFLDILNQEGVTKIKTTGLDFNPSLMECIATVEGEEGKVIEEIRAGYLLNDKVLRPAQVKVGK